MPPAFCLLDTGRIRSGNQVRLGGTQTDPPKKKGLQRRELGSGNKLLDGEKRGSKQVG